MSRATARLIGTLAGILIGTTVAMLATAFLWGVLWIFVFGDDPWPDWTYAAAGATFWLVLAVAAAVSGRAIASHLAPAN